MSRPLAQAIISVLLYVALTLAPLAIILVSAGKPGRSFWTEFSVGLGFVGLAMMCLQFILTARFRTFKAPFGSDIIYAFHRSISTISVVFILLHPAILFFERWEQMKSRPFTHPWPFWLGTLSVVALLVLVVVSIYRKQLRIHYDGWRRTHAMLGVLAVGAAVAHVLLVGHYLSEPWQRAAWLAYTGVWLLLIVWVRLAKPLKELREPWTIDAVQPQRGGAVRLVLRPVNHPGLTFQPGQFAWITMWGSPLSDREHPFSFSGSAEAAKNAGPIEFTIKELGDWTRRVREAKVGDPVYVDGPFGALSADRFPNRAGYVFIAGGIGITPMISHLRTFADRGDQTPCWLFYGNPTWDSVTYREELDALAVRLPNLKIVHVLSRPDDSWQGERGFITTDILAKHLPADLTSARNRYEFFICGPVPMMEAVEQSLAQLGISVGDYHAERFDLV